MRFQKTILAGLMAVASAGSFAADTAELKVTGTITPAACVPNFGGGGVVDFGKIASQSLSLTAATELPSKTVAYTITCDALTKTAFTFTDNRADTASITDANVFGLGKSGAANDKKTGYYKLYQVAADLRGDGAAVDSIWSSDNGYGWARHGDGQVMRGRLNSYSKTGTLVPGAYMTVTGVIKVVATIAARNTLDLTEDVKLDGLTTITIKYV